MQFEIMEYCIRKYDSTGKWPGIKTVAEKFGITRSFAFICIDDARRGYKRVNIFSKNLPKRC